MTHKQTWTEIAEAFLTPENEGTWKQKQMTRSGLCFARYGLSYSRDDPTIKFIGDIGCGHPSGWWFRPRGMGGHKREHDFIRGDFATLMACLTEKEFNQLLAGTPAQQGE